MIHRTDIKSKPQAIKKIRNQNTRRDERNVHEHTFNIAFIAYITGKNEWRG